MKAAETLAGEVGVAAATSALGVGRATIYRHRRPRAAPRCTARPPSTRALVPAERERALAVLHAPEFVDKAPAEITATILDRGLYVGSTRTLYRLLTQHGELRERRDQRRHPPRAVPRLCATAPNTVWSWDITPLSVRLLIAMRSPLPATGGPATAAGIENSNATCTMS